MKGTILLVGAGGWVLCQLFGGELLQRLGIVGTPEASTITVTPGNQTTPGEDARDRRAATTAPSPAPRYTTHPVAQ